jgi:glycosyltransferase involved in cell wall biosynthesis
VTMLPDTRPLVVHLIDELPPDGAERLVVDILRYPNPRFRYAVGCLIRGGVLQDELQAMGIPVIVFGRCGRLDVGLIVRLVRWMRAEGVQVVHTHLFTADTYGRIAAWIAGVPGIFCTVHNIVNPWKGVVRRAIDWVLARVSTRVIGCSDEVAEVLKTRDHLPADRIVAIRNGIDLRRFQSISGDGVRDEFGIPSGRLLLAVIGRLHPQKAHHELLQVFAGLEPETRAKFVCLIVGDGELRQSLEEESARLGLSGQVIFTGLRRDVPRLLSALDLFVMSSRWEGLPIALLEAMACGVTPLSTAVGGVPDVIENGVNGMLVEAGDGSAMAAKLRLLIDDDDLRLRLGRKAQEDVLRRYDVLRTAEAYDALYRDALGLPGQDSLAPIDAAASKA